MTTISIHQPVYLPWLGFFGKIISSDIFVILDDDQYEKNGWQNRNKIRTFDGDSWLTIPVKTKSGTLLKDVLIDNSSNWAKKHSKSIIFNYSKTPFFNEFWKELGYFYSKQFGSLIELNIEMIKLFLQKFNINTELILSSKLDIHSHSSERIIDICKNLSAKQYISGMGGKDYLKVEDFNKNNIKVKFQNFQHPSYKQMYEPFYPNMAAIDLIFNTGENSENILKKAKNF